ncbi:MAG: exodeoxyribonuclease V subunit gamma [Angustibacter sp.]
MLHLHRSERADALVGALAAVLADPPDDPFTPDVVAVPTRGVERWLAQRLSHHLGARLAPAEAGVCANVSFGSPARLVSGALAATLDLQPDDDPWRSSALTWPLLQVVDECAGEPWCAVLGRHLGAGDDDDLRQGRRLSVVRHLARLFTAYAAQRPDMVRAWAEGRDDDGTGQPMPADLAWQLRLWRVLRERLAVPSPAERLPVAVRRLVDEPGLLDLPARLSVFGPTRLAADQLAVLQAVSVHRDVHLWLVHPSPALWREVAGLEPTTPRRSGLGSPAQHPLLASMARDVTELQLRLAALGPASDTHHAAPEPASTLLGAVQRRLRDDDPGGAPHRPAPDDHSVQVHACHGRARQVEVLREVLVGLFADDPTLEPRDVVVMCPDVEAFAPLLAATFGLAGDSPASAAAAGVGARDDGDDLHPGQRLRVRLADRSLRLTNPVLDLVSTLLELADSRVTASQVLDLAASEPVRRRFRFDDDELDRVRQWSVAAGVHWGEDVGRRARFGLGELRQGTWDTALDRLLLGVAMADEDARFVGSALPLDDVDSTDIDLAGRLAELLDRLSAVLEGLDRRAPVGQWLDRLDLALDQLADAPPAQAWQLVQARQVLADVRQAATAADVQAPLRLPDVRALLADRLAGRPTRAGFRTGALTVCSLEPMRAVPHRVVCLLGLDDGAFPRSASSDGDDVLLRDPCLGERDRRSEDRQLFLDAVASAQEHLVVVYSGADERTGAVRPPAVPVSELLDAVEQAADGSAVRHQVLVRHPLQVVDERNFAPGELQRPGPFSWDRRSYVAALAARGERADDADGSPLVARPLPVQPRAAQVDLDDLVEAFEHPARWFLRRRLGVSVAGEVDDVDDRVPLELGPLDAWQVGDRLLAACLAGIDRDRAVAAEWRRGDVPPKELGRTALTGLVDKVTPLAAAALARVREPATAVDVWAELPSGLAVVGTVSGVHGDVLVRTVFSRLGPKHRLRAWVQLLALVVSQPDRPWRAVTIGRPQGSRPGVLAAELIAPSPAVAEQRLEELVRLRERAERAPLPVPVDTAFAYASARYGGNEVVQATEAAERQWVSDLRFSDDYQALCWGRGCTFDVLAGAPDADERRWWPEETTRLGVLARRLWQPLLDHETTGLL